MLLLLYKLKEGKKNETKIIGKVQTNSKKEKRKNKREGRKPKN